ncbi:hypothetical protein ABZT03_03700 [Streptomyces sp. NPDC005574]|uniref:hypothetical protein n=1 Tax=Streptomyces sp. NPDC005574 TaxID=3156891 RepID=UPI0033B7670E
MPPRHLVRAAAAAAVLLAGAVGCGDGGGLHAAGATPTATGPDKLWPDLRPASSPAWDYEDGDSELVRGVTAPGDDIHRVDPVDVVRAEIRRHPAAYTGPKATYRETVRRMDDCGGTATGGGAAAEGATPGTGASGRGCPVLRAYYRDLTGDGRDDLTLGFRLLPGNQTAVRVYTVRSGRLVQVMSNDDAVTGVELAGRSVIIRSPSDIPAYEYRFQWTWDPEQRLMLLTHDEMLRTGDGKHAERRASTAAPSLSPSPTTSSSPSLPPSPTTSSPPFPSPSASTP